MTLNDWTDIAQSASVVMASLVAIYGIDAWRREFVGKRRMELGEEVLALFYQARDIIESIRNPGGYVTEGQTRKPGPRETLEDKERLDRAYVLVERYNEHLEVFSRIHALRYRFHAQFGSAAVKPFDDLNGVVADLMLAARRMARYSTGPDPTFRSDKDFEEHQNKLVEIDRIYYAGGDDDPIGPRVEQLVSEMECTCRGIIENHGTLFAMINKRLWGRNG